MATKSVSKFAILMHVILTMLTGGLWLVVLVIWYLLKK